MLVNTRSKSRGGVDLSRDWFVTTQCHLDLCCVAVHLLRYAGREKHEDRWKCDGGPEFFEGYSEFRDQLAEFLWCFIVKGGDDGYSVVEEASGEAEVKIISREKSGAYFILSVGGRPPKWGW